MQPISDEIEEELELIAREVEHLAFFLRRFTEQEPPAPQEKWEATSLCASTIEKIYTGCERVMARFADGVDGVRIEKGDSWHRALLERMKQPFQDRDGIITAETHELLDRMRAFRHRERNSYGFDLDTEIVLERAHEIIKAYNAFSADIRQFLKAQPDSNKMPEGLGGIA